METRGATGRTSEAVDGGQEERWSSVLREVSEETKDNRPWLQKVGEFLAWAGGIALGADVVAVLVLGIVSLVSQVSFTSMQVSNWIFYASCILLFAGLLAPTSTDLQDGADGRRQRQARGGASSTQRASSRPSPSREERTQMARLETRRVLQIRKRMRRMYDPWRWRLWVSAAVSLLMAILVDYVTRGSG